MSDGDRQPLDDLIDLLVYAPVGFFYEYNEVLPKLVRRGKSQVQLAKVLGQMALKQRQGVASAGGDLLSGGMPLEADPVSTVTSAVAKAITDVGAAIGLAPVPNEDGNESTDTGPVDSTDSAESEDSNGKASTEEPLPIAGYDGLPAREVVTLLSDLSADQLAAVRVYESSHKARKTILSKIARLEDRSTS